LEVICPDKTLLTAERPAPVSIYWESMDFASDMVWKALAPVAPKRLTMGHFLSVCGTIISGIHPDTGELFILVEPQAGGWGAGADRDGENGLVSSGDGETYNTPVEIAETRYGVLVEQYALHISDGGAGKYRGGWGLIRDYRILSDEAYITGTFGRFKYFPWGGDGGHSGSPNFMEMIHEDGSSQIFGKTAQYKLKRGEIARMVTGTGGGYGNPQNRPHKMIAQDLRDGYITATMAARDYGVALTDSIHTAHRTIGK
jgi:N-methylhydantoinase B